LTANDSGATQALPAAAVINNGSSEVYHRTTGGTTPTLTLPTAASVLALWLDNVLGVSSYRLRVINNNSGTATVALGTGWTNVTSGTLTLATNTWRDFVVTYTAAGTLDIASVGTGTDS
jgi:hypothetical protein